MIFIKGKKTQMGQKKSFDKKWEAAATKKKFFFLGQFGRIQIDT